MNGDLVYWIALSQIKNWGVERINQVIIKVIHEQKEQLSDLFSYDTSELKNKIELSEKEIFYLEEVKRELPQYSFLTEDLLAQGYEIITIDSPKYSKTLKDNLKIKSSPPIIYIKGNKQLLHEKSVAIVGSRDADDISLKFTDEVAKNASKDFKVVVSGFAKGVDKQALDSAIKYKGQSIIVLPQGIMTFGSGFNKYYQEIQAGDVLVLSTFFPKATWSVQLAMARNPIIYGVADDIYVAQSSDKGGTWSGVIDGLRKGRKIFVRLPELNEKNANNLLIERGAIPVNLFGDIVKQDLPTEIHTKIEKDVPEKKNGNDNIDSIEFQIRELLKDSILFSEEIKKSLELDWKTSELTEYLKKQPWIKFDKENKRYKFSLRSDTIQTTLFS